MDCVDILNNYHGNIADGFKRYIGDTLINVVADLRLTYEVLPYRICDLKNGDVIIWKSRTDNCAHVNIFHDNYFHNGTPGGIKKHPVLLQYRHLVKPKYIVRWRK